MFASLHGTCSRRKEVVFIFVVFKASYCKTFVERYRQKRNVINRTDVVYIVRQRLAPLSIDFVILVLKSNSLFAQSEKITLRFYVLYLLCPIDKELLINVFLYFHLRRAKIG